LARLNRISAQQPLACRSGYRLVVNPRTGSVKNMNRRHNTAQGLQDN
jgi:hypothetical protein